MTTPADSLGAHIDAWLRDLERACCDRNPKVTARTGPTPRGVAVRFTGGVLFVEGPDGRLAFDIDTPRADLVDAVLAALAQPETPCSR